MTPVVPSLPETAPFSTEQRQWLNGFLAGMYSRGPLPDAGALPETGAARAPEPLTILYGSQTGTAEGLAQETAEKAESLGFAPDVLELDEFEAAKLREHKRVLILTSTYGDGEMPDNARGFWEQLSSEDLPSCADLQYSVLALGDSNYETFCTAGRDIDARLEALGARRVAERVDCDVDYEEPFAGWLDRALEAIRPGEGEGGTAGTEVSTAVAKAPAKKRKGPNRKNPFFTRLKENRVLNKEGSDKDVRHYVIELPEEEIAYTTGDALLVIPENDPRDVEALIAALDLDPGAEVERDGVTMAFEDALRTRMEIRLPAKSFVETLARKADAPHMNARMEDPSELAAWLEGREVLDLVREMPVAWTEAEFLDALKPIQGRAYSISSSPKAHPGEVHLCVSTVTYESMDREQRGVCSGFLAARTGDRPFGVYLTPNKHFGPPADSDAPMIMVGPGTGIAPFRAFLEERLATGAKGKNWLFFGDRHAASDFLYEEDIRDFMSKGVLHSLDLAWSRDGEKKVYVQDRMRENAGELFQWLEDGAYFFVCGDAHRMAKDVDTALLEIIKSGGDLDEEGAKAYLDRLRKEKRYVRDVY